MNTNQLKNTLIKHWKSLYNDDKPDLLDEFVYELQNTKESLSLPAQDEGWYKDAIIYSLYVDLFNKDFNGLKEKLPYLRDLGVNCLWLLPILDSPMKDAGFDIRDYTRIRGELLGLQDNCNADEAIGIFREFLDEAHKKGIRVIFDIALNHTSEEHEWFRQARSSEDNPYRDFYIWNRDDQKYQEARLLFKGMCPSNWEKDGDWYFFHRFFGFQPDLNYQNPKVLLAMLKNLIFWLEIGVDGFRADAIPYLWKEEGSNCENLPETHTIIKIFRAVVDYLSPNTLLLAEACQPPHEVVKYFGNNDECHAGYHFPIMPQIFKALAIENRMPVIETLHPDVTPVINDDNQWFMFLRLHDELTLEMVTEQDRKIIHDHYCRDPRWDFRLGEGIAARLAELLEFNPQKIGLAYSIMLTLPGTPLIYYGDEWGRGNDEEYYESMKALTGYNDTRYFVRGPVDWEVMEKLVRNTEGFNAGVHQKLKTMLNTRQGHKAFSRGKLEWTKLGATEEILSFIRKNEDEEILVVHNLSQKICNIILPLAIGEGRVTDLLGQEITIHKQVLSLKPHAYHWFILR